MDRTMKDTKTHTGSGRRMSAAVSTMSMGILCLLTTTIASDGGLPAQDRAGVLDQTRSVLEKWVETRQIISREKRDWALGQELLNDRIGIVKREIQGLRSRVEDAEKSVSEAEGTRSGLEQQNTSLKETSAVLDRTVATLETRTRTLLARLPEPLKDRVRPLSQKIPVQAEDTKLSLSERFQNIVGLLNEVNKFQREITITTEVMQLANGTKAEVSVLYVGISQGYYVTNNGDAAGTGTAGAQGFEWTEANAAAPHVKAAIAVLKNEQVARFVPLPIRIQ